MAADGASAAVHTIGSRKSDLAMWQAREVQALLSKRFADGQRDRFPIQTEVALGDSVLDKSLAVLAAANPGVFTKELEVGLLGGAYTIAVHSLKDMPTSLPPGLALVGISAREDARDAVVLARRHTLGGGGGASTLSDLPPGSRVGTSSVRREALLRTTHPGLHIVGVRGNLNTRLRKLDAPLVGGEGKGVGDAAAAAEGVCAGETVAPAASLSSCDARDAATAGTAPPPPPPADGGGQYDALVLAAAGLARMGWSDRISERLDPHDFPYGVSQGALGIEGVVGDAHSSVLGRAVTHGPTALRCLAERAFLRKLQGGCQVPVGVCSWYEDGEGKDGVEGWRPTTTALTAVPPPHADGQPERVRTLTLEGLVLSLDGSTSIAATVSETVCVPEPAEGGEEGSGVEGLSAAVVPTTGPLLSQSQWDALVVEGERVGVALADKVLKGGAAELLAPLGVGSGGPPRPLTYGAAEGVGQV